MSVYRKFSDSFPTIFPQVCGGYTIKILLTNCSFYTENIWTLAYCADLTSFGCTLKLQSEYFAAYNNVAYYGIIIDRSIFCMATKFGLLQCNHMPL